ncbi:MAG TPA: enoyl-CoA hydratase/isomerase family protein [Acidimicrobiales bacterium]|nr:enoyl-CoA hydratase/isomerase family protein [Acidimicrobiales bacterium]
MPDPEVPDPEVPHPDVTVEVADHVAVVELHRPPDNFFDAALVAAVADAVEQAADDGHRAVVLCSEGKNFCAGAAIGTGGDDPTRTPMALYRQGVRLFAGPLPVVAAVQGAAVGGGLGLALAADFRVATPESRFHCNFARLGFHHGFGTTVTLPAVVGQQRAWELLYTGGQARGEEALRIGLCDRLVPADQLRPAALALAADIAASGPLAVRAIRQTVRADLVHQVRLAVEREAEAQLALVGTDDFAEGVRATAERRPPRFTGH